MSCAATVIKFGPEIIGPNMAEMTGPETEKDCGPEFQSRVKVSSWTTITEAALKIALKLLAKTNLQAAEAIRDARGAFVEESRRCKNPNGVREAASKALEAIDRVGGK